jgi:transposase
MRTIEERLDQIEAILLALAQQQTLREWYSTDQVAQIVGKSEFTVREWARLGRIHAEKRRSGRGAHASWAISHAELLRLQREGLLPVDGH